MKIEKLNENKIKITLDNNDLKSRNIDARSLIYNTPESQDLFWEVMQEAEKKYDFQVDESMVYVEAHVSQSGVFTLIVTRNQGNATKKKSKIQDKNIVLKRKELPEDLNSKLFRFNSFSALCDFCKIADKKGYGKTSLYLLDDKYYLYISLYSGNSILEFADIDQHQDKTLAKISEYGKTIYKDSAIRMIQKHLEE
ncbi:MAG: adaptor protein MecA [Clostridia bacterium]|nr:adaptor protein MecA [Clostridia bacterium]